PGPSVSAPRSVPGPEKAPAVAPLPSPSDPPTASAPYKKDPAEAMKNDPQARAPALDKLSCKRNEDEGYRLKLANQYQASYDAFSVAYEQCKKPWLIAELGRAKQNLRKYPEAVRLYRDFLNFRPAQPANQTVRVNELIRQACVEVINERKQLVSS